MFWPNQKGLSVLQYAKNRKSVLPVYTMLEKILNKNVKDHVEQEWNDLEWSGITLEWKGVDNKSREQPWPQLMCCASISCHMCGCIFQED